MKNTINKAQYKTLLHLAEEWQNTNHPDRLEDFLAIIPVSADGSGSTYFEEADLLTFEAHDIDGKTDFDILRELIKEAGIDFDWHDLLSDIQVARLEEDDEIPTARAYWGRGDTDTDYHHIVPLYYVNLVITHN